MKHRILLLLSTGLCLAGAAGAHANGAALPNPSFEEGGDAPSGWSVPDGGSWGRSGAALGERFVTVTGEGAANWRSDPIAFVPNAVYELRYRWRYRPGAAAASAYAVVGPEFAIRVIALPAGESTPRWHEEAVRFAAPTPADPALNRIVLGQWQLRGALDYDALELYPVQLAHRTEGGVALGEGESIAGSTYRFSAPLDAWRTVSRALAAFNDHFHDDRWRFTKPDGQVTYRHAVAGRKQTRAWVQPAVWFHEETSWKLAVEASTNGKDYRGLGALKQGEPAPKLEVPAEMLPAGAVWIRLRADTSDARKPVFFQCRGYAYEAVLDGPPCHVSGRSAFFTVLQEDPAVRVEPMAQREGAFTFAARVTNRSRTPVTVEPILKVSHAGTGAHTYRGKPQRIPAGAAATVAIPYAARAAGTYGLEFSLGGGVRARLASSRTVSTLEAGDYGECLASPHPGVALWWASSGWKVSRDRPVPQARGAAVKLRLARNEAEGTQIVVRPARALKGLTASAGPLRSATGHALPASAVEVLRVRYVNVEYASDELGGVGEWPDPLPPFRGGIGVQAGRNQPLWVRVRAPKDARPGLYKGAISLRAEGFQAEVPLAVEVYDFTLPDASTCRSLFGFGAGNVLRYHNLKRDADKRAVMDKYLRSFAEHRISPYNPAPLDGFTHAWDTGMDWDGGRIVAEAHSGQQAVEVRDGSETAAPMVGSVAPLPVSGKPMRVSLWYRTERDSQPASLILMYLDAARAHIPYRNVHLSLPATTGWRRFETTVSAVPEGAAFVRPSLLGCEWSEKGERTGCVWVDEVSIVDTGTGAELVRDGGFEEARPAAGARVTFDWAAWDRAMERAMREYHFNSFVIGVPGLGGGTFHSRHEGSLCGFAAGTPEYRALLRAWCDAAREHLAAKGWLDKAVVYPFDEPAEKDYAFVVAQLKRLKENFPGLRRMVPMMLGAADDFVGTLDYWCPILHSHRREFAAERQRAGDAYTWYICCAPKAPYIANFIDRPATDLRVWLWQTWQEHVDGVLIWESVWWTSGAAYPETPQNPYEDSMSWVDGYDTPKGEKRRWNVGDGRFLYPPEAATGRQTEAVLDGPVSSIRWEALRDGMEDYEYLALLKRLLVAPGPKLPVATRARCERLLAVPPAISASLTRYTTDPAPIESRREEIARAIEELSKVGK